MKKHVLALIFIIIALAVIGASDSSAHEPISAMQA